MNMLQLLFLHPLEFRTLLQYRLYYQEKRDISAPQEHPTSRWNRKTMRRCWEFLDQAGRSYAAVIKELDGDLARTIALFYLVLRGLDTIEDDMTLPNETKQALLRSFHEKTVTPGWNFDGNGPDEKDRQLLVEYDAVIEEINSLDPHYREVIVDICHKMENGMADFAHRHALTGSIYLETIADYDLYCHYVAGLVGEGLSRIFSASGKEAGWLQHELPLANSMGLMLQKTNIIRDFREDLEARRFFWPREIWGRAEYGSFKEMGELCREDEENERRAMWVLSGMVVDALRHACDALDYLNVLRNGSVFKFCAIPQVMAIATLERVFMNPAVLHRNVKIRKAEAAKLIMAASNTRDVAYIFRDYARKIHARALPADPNFLRLSVACGKIEQWCESQYPSFVRMKPPTADGGEPDFTVDRYDARSRVVELDRRRDAELEREKGSKGRAVDLSAARKDRSRIQMSTSGIVGFVALLTAIVMTFGWRA